MSPRLLLSLLIAFSLTPLSLVAQSISVGADIMSRYVWRGTDFGESLSLQPTLALSAGGFEIGSWASYSVSADGGNANEHDLWIGYTFETESAGSFSIGVTDYYFPALDPRTEQRPDFFNFDGDGEGSHWLEPYLSYSGAESFPISLSLYIMAHNDPDNSIYIEGSIPFDVGGTEVGFTMGLVAGASDFYGVDGASVINMSLSAGREIKITDDFSLPISASYIMDPTHKNTFLVFGISL